MMDLMARSCQHRDVWRCWRWEVGCRTLGWDLEGTCREIFDVLVLPSVCLS